MKKDNDTAAISEYKLNLINDIYKKYELILLNNLLIHDHISGSFTVHCYSRNVLLEISPIFFYIVVCSKKYSHARGFEKSTNFHYFDFNELLDLIHNIYFPNDRFFSENILQKIKENKKFKTKFLRLFKKELTSILLDIQCFISLKDFVTCLDKEIIKNI